MSRFEMTLLILCVFALGATAWVGYNDQNSAPSNNKINRVTIAPVANQQADQDADKNNKIQQLINMTPMNYKFIGHEENSNRTLILTDVIEAGVGCPGLAIAIDAQWHIDQYGDKKLKCWKYNDSNEVEFYPLGSPNAPAPTKISSTKFQKFLSPYEQEQSLKNIIANANAISREIEGYQKEQDEKIKSRMAKMPVTCITNGNITSCN